MGNLVSYTCAPLVSRSEKGPGTTRGPCELSKATEAARGTRGGFTCMVQATRLMPRCLVAGTVSSTLPAASSTSSLMGPYWCRLRWYQVMTAPEVGFSPTKVASPSAQPPRGCTRCWVGREERKAASLASSPWESARRGVMSSMIQMPRP